ncbi:hypothetical protein Bca52824_093183 [Brassica carinata]|uniref:GTD-binding domain-containing protein n=1 Tax=Brassica carinata TaxID=52824 RepID=A0A8X7TKA1_BRACI|nr:hypothetical protein Bca52824_093183 [Brassica carinata]
MADLVEGAEIEEVNAVEGERFQVGTRERAVKWASPSEFVTGGYGFGLQLWGIRGRVVKLFRSSMGTGEFLVLFTKFHNLLLLMFQGKAFAVVHSIDIHPSRKHTCIFEQPPHYSSVTTAGGSCGTVFDIDRQNPQLRVGVNSNLLKALVSRPVQAQVSISNTWQKEVGQTATVGPTGTNTCPYKSFCVQFTRNIHLFCFNFEVLPKSKRLNYSPLSYDLRDMLERSSSFRIPGAEIIDLRLAFYERKEVIERLQDELNAEREASATSASEALSMILRLQGEKAELAREAGQYKRIAEEEMSHAETWFAHLEDFIHQKELVITALEYQVAAYRSQLLSLGYSDLSSLDVKLQENDKNDVKVKMNHHHESLSDRSQIPSPDLSIPVEKEVIEESLDSQKSYFDVYWDHIKKMDEKVKELKSEDALKMKVAKQTKMKKKPPKQTRDRSGKRDRAEYQAELQRLRQRVEQLERERTKTVPETSGVTKQEEISRLTEMKEEVSPVQSSEVKRSNPMENLQPWIDPTIVSVQEAMLNFWL